MSPHCLSFGSRQALGFAAIVLAFVLAAVISGWATEPNGALPTTVEPASAALESRFAGEIQGFVRAYCLDCHGADKQEAKLDLRPFENPQSITRQVAAWKHVVERVEKGEMPPEESDRRPSDAERQALIAWTQAWLRQEAQRHAGDPGVVLARRLSNAEFDYTIRDLSGIDIRPTRQFPVDPANESGFDNTGESLRMSPSLVKKYLEAARHVSDHLVLTPTTVTFAPHPVVTDTDRDKYCVQRIINFYDHHRVDLADYFLAAWKLRHRDALGQPDTTLSEVAHESRLSEKYLRAVWDALGRADVTVGPWAALRDRFSRLPEPGAGGSDRVRAECEALRDSVNHMRKQLIPKITDLRSPGISNTSQTLLLWRNRQQAANHRRFAEEQFPLNSLVELPADEDQRLQVTKSYEQFCALFPDAFVISERSVGVDPLQGGQGRLLSAGFHLMQGYFRDDQPLYDLVLTAEEQDELDALWRELNFITNAPVRQYKDFIFFERAEPPRFIEGAEFDFARSEDKDAVSEPRMRQLREAYLEKARRKGASEVAVTAIEHYFDAMSAEIRWEEQARLAAEPAHLDWLAKFAERAYRRPLTATETSELAAFYQDLRHRDGLAHEDALRDTVASILLSPNFLFRLVPAVSGDQPQPLDDYALASRLSYFLWSSMPDEQLFARAASGDLHEPQVLVREAKRMLQDPRARGLATEFGGNWLDFRRFEEHNSVDRQRYPAFTDELRQSMYEEPLQFLMHAASEDKSVLDLLYADYTYVNSVLAEHYQIPDLPVDAKTWIRVAEAERFGRGGLLRMAVFQTCNSPGLRTSPVKRGYWVVRRLLGEQIPAPPPNVPELPKDEADLGSLSLPQLLARHRDHKSCAGCHDRFDSIGLAFEGFDPVGALRLKDQGGRPVEDLARFPDGSEGKGVVGLLTYLRQKREKDFVDNFCRKLFSYGLSRGLQLTDEPGLLEMQERLAANQFRFSAAVEFVVTSPQFLLQRGGQEE